MTVGAVVELKAELVELNQKCQLARDNEVRYALQRSRLEAERAQLLVKLMDAQLAASAPAEPCAEPVRPVAPLAPSKLNGRAVFVPAEPEAPAGQQQQPYARPTHKPDGLPTYQQMVQQILDDAAPKWLAPRDMTAIIRQTWWSGVPRHKAASTAWTMARAGILDSRGGCYRAKPNGHAG